MTPNVSSPTNWLGERWKPTELHAPRESSEVLHLLDRAVAEGRKVGILGGGFSCAPAYRTNELQLVTTRLDRIGPFDPATRTIAVGAGTTLRALNACLRSRGLAYGLVSVSTLDEATIGGLVANGCHGSDPRYGTIADQVVALEVFVREGRATKRVRFTSESDPERFPYLLGNLGLLGFVETITLRLEPLHAVEVRVRKRPVGAIFDESDPSELRALATAEGQALLTHLPFADGLLVRTLRKSEAEATPYGFGDRLPWRLSPRINRFCTRTLRAFPKLTPTLNQALHGAIAEETSVRHLTEAVHANDRQSAYRCVMSAFAIRAEGDFANIARAWRSMQEVLDGYAAKGAYPLNCCINARFVGGSVLPLSPVHGTKDDRFFVVDFLSYVGTPGYDHAIRAIVDRWSTEGLAPKPFFAKLGPSILGPKRLRETYGQALVEFLALREAMDPDGTFLGDHHARLFGLEHASGRRPSPTFHPPLP
ncbi:MAG: FAD-binding oxidoreductase [Polyangiales bacterium]